MGHAVVVMLAMVQILIMWSVHHVEELVRVHMLTLVVLIHLANEEIVLLFGTQ